MEDTELAGPLLLAYDEQEPCEVGEATGPNRLQDHNRDPGHLENTRHHLVPDIKLDVIYHSPRVLHAPFRDEPLYPERGAGIEDRENYGINPVGEAIVALDLGPRV